MEEQLKQLKENYEKIKLSDSSKSKIYKHWVDVRSEKTEYIIPFYKRASVLAAACAIILVLSLTVYKLTPIPTFKQNTVKYSKSAFISSLNGNVFIKTSTNPKEAIPLKNGDILNEGTIIETKLKSNTNFAFNNHNIALSADTSLKLTSFMKSDLKFNLQKGSVSLTVSPLEKNEVLQVISKDVIVQVIGTQFTVSKLLNCTNVSVTEGKVKIIHNTKTTYLEKNGLKSFCSNNAKLNPIIEKPLLTQTDNNVSSLDKKVEQKLLKEIVIKKDKSNKIKKQKKNLNNKLLAMASTPPTGEEKLFNMAQQSIIESKSYSISMKYFSEYIAQYENGIFIEDALFNMAKLSYKAKNYLDVYKYSKQLRAKIDDNNYRTKQINLFYAQSILELKRDAGEAVIILGTLITELDKLSSTMKEQTVYLYTLAALRLNDCVTTIKWSKYYLQNFTNGRYTNSIKSFLATDSKCNTTNQ